MKPLFVLPNEEPLLIAEVAQAHDGSLGMAHAFIDAAASAGADAIKFQTHIASEESSEQEPWRIKFSPQDETRYSYWKRMEFSEEQWFGLKRHAEENRMIFLSTPFSLKAVEILNRLGMEAWKIASGEICNSLLMDAVLDTKKPVILSSGLSNLEEIDAVVDRLKSRNTPFGVMQCTTAYPCPPEKVGLNMLAEFAERYGCPVGLSDHSGTIYPCLVAAYLGAQFLEVHVTFSKMAFGPDAHSSITFDQLLVLTAGVKNIYAMRLNPVSKVDLDGDVLRLRSTFGQSLVAKIPLYAGQILEREHISTRKPQIGIPASDWEKWIGKKIRLNLEAGAFLKEEHFF